MQDIQAAVTAAMQSMVKEGDIEKMIAKSLKTTVEKIVADALSSYSNFGKQLATAVTEALAIDPKDLGIGRYNATVLAVVKEQLDGSIERIGREKLAAEMTKLLSDSAPAEIKLSDLVRQFKREACKYREIDRVTVIFRQSYPDSQILQDYYTLALAPNAGVDEHRCPYHFSIDKGRGTTSVTRIEGIDTEKGGLFGGSLHGFARTMFHLYAAGTKVVVDEEYFSDTIDDEDREKTDDDL